jgi:hypothetical protein
MTTKSLENKGPSIAELQRFIQDKTQLEFILVNSQKISGRLRWFDEESFSVVQADDSNITLLKLGVIGYRSVVISEKSTDKQSNKSQQKAPHSKW